MFQLVESTHPFQAVGFESVNMHAPAPWLTVGTQVSKLKNTLFKDVDFKNTWDPCAHCENLSHLLKSNKLSHNKLLYGVKYPFKHGCGLNHILCAFQTGTARCDAAGATTERAIILYY